MDIKPKIIFEDDDILIGKITGTFSNVEMVYEYYPDILEVWRGTSKKDGENCFIIQIKLNGIVFVCSSDCVESYPDFFYGIATMAKFWDATLKVPVDSTALARIKFSNPPTND